MRRGVIIPARDEEASIGLVIGSRIRGEREPGALLPQAYFGNRLATLLIRILWTIVRLRCARRS